jgi:hypothetical protein
MSTGPTLQNVEQAVRSQVCIRCPLRTPGTEHYGCEQSRPCESGCELFQLLPKLHQTAGHLEPMIGHRPRLLRDMLNEAAANERLQGEIIRSLVPTVVETINNLYLPD